MLKDLKKKKRKQKALTGEDTDKSSEALGDALDEPSSPKSQPRTQRGKPRPQTWRPQTRRGVATS